MKPIRLTLTLLAWLAAMPAIAAETAMTGDDIRAALSGMRVQSIDGKTTQTFYASGETVYTANDSPSQGGWDVRRDFYCSVWPPNEHWSCYRMVRDGDVLTFIGEGGDRYPVRVVGKINP